MQNIPNQWRLTLQRPVIRPVKDVHFGEFTLSSSNATTTSTNHTSPKKKKNVLSLFPRLIPYTCPTPLFPSHAHTPHTKRVKGEGENKKMRKKHTHSSFVSPNNYTRTFLTKLSIEEGKKPQTQTKQNKQPSFFFFFLSHFSLFSPLV